MLKWRERAKCPELGIHSSHQRSLHEELEACNLFRSKQSPFANFCTKSILSGFPWVCNENVYSEEHRGQPGETCHQKTLVVKKGWESHIPFYSTALTQWLCHWPRYHLHVWDCIPILLVDGNYGLGTFSSQFLFQLEDKESSLTTTKVKEEAAHFLKVYQLSSRQ